MIFGSYPCCNGSLTLSMPDRTPAYLPEECPHCGAKVWHRLSRVQVTSWTEAEFLEQHFADLETRMITAKPGTNADRFEKMNEYLGKRVEAGILSLDQAMALASVIDLS